MKNTELQKYILDTAYEALSKDPGRPSFVVRYDMRIIFDKMPSSIFTKNFGIDDLILLLRMFLLRDGNQLAYVNSWLHPEKTLWEVNMVSIPRFEEKAGESVEGS